MRGPDRKGTCEKMGTGTGRSQSFNVFPKGLHKDGIGLVQPYGVDEPEAFSVPQGALPRPWAALSNAFGVEPRSVFASKSLECQSPVRSSQYWPTTPSVARP